MVISSRAPSCAFVSKVSLRGDGALEEMTMPCDAQQVQVVVVAAREFFSFGGRIGRKDAATVGEWLCAKASEWRNAAARTAPTSSSWDGTRSFHRSMCLLVTTLALSLGLLGHNALADTPSEATHADVVAPAPAADQELKNPIHDIDRLDDELSAIESEKKNIDVYLEAISHEQIDKDALRTALADASSALDSVRKTALASRNCQHIIWTLGTVWNELHPGKLVNPANYETTALFKEVYRKYEPDQNSKPKVQRAYDLVQNKQIVPDCKSAQTEDAFARLQLDLKEIEQSPDKELSAVVRQRSQDATAHRLLLENAVYARQHEKQSALNDLETEISGESRTTTVLRTVALPMIVTLVVLYVITMAFPHSIQNKLIDSRTLVEVVGIAFVLLVVMALGTAGKLPETVLGTLLGSIASYIFGQQMARRRERSPPVNSDLAEAATIPSSSTTGPNQVRPDSLHNRATLLVLAASGAGLVMALVLWKPTSRVSEVIAWWVLLCLAGIVLAYFFALLGATVRTSRESSAKSVAAEPGQPES
jgi:hypothetical protein